MEELAVIYNAGIDKKWFTWIRRAMDTSQVSVIYLTAEEAAERNLYASMRLVFLCDLNEIGRDEGIDWLLRSWTVKNRANLDRHPHRFENQGLLHGVKVALICRSQTDWHTKTYGRNVLLLLNAMGATAIGRPLVEILPGYENFMTWQKTYEMDLESIAEFRVADLVKRLKLHRIDKKNKMNLLVLHSSSSRTSNTLALWRLVEDCLKDLQPNCIQIEEIFFERGSVTDCIGCNYDVCVAEARQLSCVVGGQYVEEIMPAMEKADVLVWICPNYNDTLSGDLISLINRMSGFYRTRDLSGKRIYAVIVSGNSGTDAVANQLVGSLNVNKGFTLPPNFCLSEIASQPLSVLKKEGVGEKARAFAVGILKEVCEY